MSSRPLADPARSDPRGASAQRTLFAITPFALLIAIIFSGCRSTGSDPRPDRAPATPRVFGPQAESTTDYLILGDSTAVGVGGDYESGIAVSTARHLADGRRIILHNLAVSGAQTTDVLHEQLPRLGSVDPDLVLIAVGANDVTHLSSAGSVEKDLDDIIGRLIEINCDVKIVLTGAPDMSTPPRIPWILRGLAGWRTEVLNVVFRRVAGEHDLTFAPIAAETGPLFARDRSLFSEDDFHPSARGYDTWTKVLEPALEEALRDQPSHCTDSGPDQASG